MPPQSLNLGGDNGNKNVSELIESNVYISWKGTKGTPKGTIKKIEEYGSPYEGDTSGHFFPIKFAERFYDEPIQVGGEGGKTITPTNDDPYLIIRVENVTVDNKISAIVKRTNEEVFELDFSKAKLG